MPATPAGDRVPHASAAAAASPTANTSNEHNLHDEEDVSEVVETGGTKGERGKFLPRVKVLLSKDNEELLTKLVDVLELTNCAAFRNAAVDNPWFEAFDRFYDGIELDYVKPTGKNRVHKFKSKVVDMWATMESEIESGQKSPSDPIYSRAMRQWSVHQTVMKNPEAEKHHKSPADATLATGAAAHATAVAAPAVMMPSASAFVSTEFELERIRKSFLRLERMMVANGWAQPKLPSPLNELHYLKEQMTASYFDINVRETYQREITKYLAAARHQARHSNAPAHLPQLLDGLDTLRNTAQPSQLNWSIKETYDFVLRAYLRLLDPSSSLASHAMEATPRKRKREGLAAPAAPLAAAASQTADTTTTPGADSQTVVEREETPEKIHTGDADMVDMV